MRGPPTRSGSSARSASRRKAPRAQRWPAPRHDLTVRASFRNGPGGTHASMFTPHQDAALNAVAAWLKARPGRRDVPPIFRLFGYAGTGKTTLARHVAQDVDGKVLFAAFSGKA